jgi:three-Cys-motif partner protein
MEVPNSYRGREQTFVKHTLLKTYLERLFMIIGLSQPVIRYVDCFSGPWQEQSVNLSDTSIGISLNTMHNCRTELGKRGKPVEFRALYIEKDKGAYDKLNDHLNALTTSNIATAALNGEFFNLREQILNWCGHDFTFFFIDPKGWRRVVEIPTLEPLLRRPQSEFLINFMYDFLARTYPMEPFQPEMRDIFGSELPDTNGLEPKEKEKVLVAKYRDELKRIAPRKGGKPRTAYVPILYPTKNRTLYHLIYLTRHAKGIAVFMEASEKLELVQTQVRSQAKQENREARTGQLELLPPWDDSLIEESTNLAEVKEYWLNRLSFSPENYDITKLADMIEETGWFESYFQKAFGELVMEGLVKNLDDTTQRRTKNFVHFHNNERLLRLKP